MSSAGDKIKQRMDKAKKMQAEAQARAASRPVATPSRSGPVPRRSELLICNKHAFSTVLLMLSSSLGCNLTNASLKDCAAMMIDVLNAVSNSGVIRSHDERLQRGTCGCI